MLEFYKYAMDESMEKQAAIGTAGLANSLGAVATGIKNLVTIGGGTMLGGLALKAAVEHLRSDAVRKNLLEDLIRTDPVLQAVDRNTIAEWYASIYQYAPTLSKDKQTVREVLTTFARYGKMDLQTLKMLADTEKSITESKSRGGVVRSIWGQLV